ncbi:hypothetical protein AC579_3439 [Pseudocercospora musae]|uniref:Oxidoreductase n=1 Tax=Pseudocercospora musae TaxID=113226 RepID=A0A139IBR8_9PEZI|nr:hypothetical protein AC579_3439 [Pseudocercospora musae]
MAFNMFKKPVFNPEKEIPDLSGRIILVTGGTGGLGRETVLSFAKRHPRHIFFTGRSQPSAEQTIQLAKQKAPQTPVTFVKCDLASFSSVKTAATEILSSTDRLDILNANAGIMALPPGLTQNGYEIQFGTNHMGHAYLVKLLTPLLQKTAQLPGADVRVIWDTSLGYKASTGIDFPKLKTKQEDISPFMAPWFRYGQSKLANLLYARAYAKKYPEITSVSIHPGVSATGLVENLGFFQKVFVYATSYFMMIPPEQCAWNQQWAAVAPLGTGTRQVASGTWYEPVGLKGSLTKAGGDDELAEVLWRWTEKELDGWES